MEALVNNIIKATGWSIFHSLWQGAFLYGLLVLIFLTLPKLSATVKHNMAYGTICLMFLGFCGTFFSVFTWPPLSTVTNTLSLSTVIPGPVNYQTENYFPLLVGLYVTGLLLQLAILSSGYYKIMKLKHSLKLAVPKEWQVLFQGMVKDLKIKKHIGFYLSQQVNVPMVIGFIKPVVLFPVAFATRLDLVHVEAILIHELGHIRRNDYLLNILKTAMETILFFNPFTWLCSNLIQREREHACDDLVLHKTHTPLTYAHALLQIELLKEKQTPVFSMAASGNNQHLYQRIKRITDMKTTYNTAKQQFYAVGITLATLVSLAWVNPLKSEPVIKSKMETLKTRIAIETYTNTASLQDTTKNKPTKTITKKTKELKKTHKTPPKAPAPPPTPPTPPMQSAPPVPAAPPAPPAQPNGAELSRQVEKLKLEINAVVKQHMNSAEWRNQQAIEMKKMGEEMRKHFNSPEFKKEIEDIKNQSAAIAKHFDSPEWKKQQAQLKIDAQKMSAEIQQHFNSPEWKSNQAKIQADAKRISAEMQKHFNSPEFKKQIEKHIEIRDEQELKTEKDAQPLKNK